jgi:hypothetical protein
MCNLPNFLVVGFPKCGSTSLHYFLDDHPDIFMPQQKEIHFFSYDRINILNKGPKDKHVKKLQIGEFENYKKMFRTSEKRKISGEVSPSYVNYPEVCIPKIKKILGKPKIIIIVRDPIKRAYSNYLHLVREGRETLDFYQALKKENTRRERGYSDFWYYSFNSDYFNKVKAYKEAFENVLIIESEQLKEKPKSTISDVYKFLEVNKDYEPSVLDKLYNEGGVYRSNIVTNFFFRQSKARDIARKIIPAKANIKHFKQKILKRYQKSIPEIDERAKKLLIDNLKTNTKKLKETYKLSCLNWDEELFN